MRSLREGDCPRSPISRAANFSRSTLTRARFIHLDHDLWVEHREQSFDVTTAQRCEESLDNFSFLGTVSLRNRAHSPHPAASATSELPRRNRRATDDGANVLERHREH